MARWSRCNIFLLPDDFFDRKTRITERRSRLADERELWKKICERDADAFDVLYRENAPPLLAYLVQHIGDRQAAEDVLQEMFSQIWTRPNGFQPERGTLRNYLYGIAHHLAADWWRKQGPPDPTENKTGFCQTETTSIMCDALRRLPEEQRTLLWLRSVAGLSYAELAETLVIPVGTVSSRLSAAREALRRIWGKTR
jgi:RNA polymerase sigma-70 factor, ECF subfamily